MKGLIFFIVAVAIALGWFFYKVYGDIKYDQALHNIPTSANNAKFDSLKTVADRLNPGSFFSFNP